MSYSGNYKIRNLPNLATGLNDQYDAGEILDTDISDMENIEVDGKSIKSAAGYVDYGTTTGAPYWGIFNARFSSGTERMIRQRGTTLEYDNGSGSWTECTLPTSGSPAATVVLTETGCSFAMLNDIVLWSNGTDSVMSSTDGITWTIPTYGSPAQELPKSRILFNNGLNRILFMAQPSAPSRVDWSEINDPLTVGASSFQFFGKNDGQEIQDAALMPDGTMLLFKTNRFYQISDISLDTVSTAPIGEAPCVRYTVCSTENSVMWAGPDGKVYEFLGGVPNFISDNIARLSITNPSSMRAVYHNQKYRLAVPTGSNNYNSYEYVVHRNLLTGNPKHPYVITKNQRYIGCYGKEDREVDGVRRSRVYFGDSRNTAEGSPAAVPGVFAWINQEHDTSVTQGLNGGAQSCYFITKYFTEKGPFFIKRFIRYFLNLKSLEDQTITVGYRYDQFEEFTTANVMTEAASVDWQYDNGETGGFSEGYAWSASAEAREFLDLENTGTEPRGIQFKISWSSVNDIEILTQAYKFLTNRNFR
jgi:hypothetical protein